MRRLRHPELRPLRQGPRAETLRGHEARRLHGHQGDRCLLVSERFAVKADLHLQYTTDRL